MLKLYTWLLAAAPISLWAQGGLVNNGAFINVNNATLRVSNGSISNSNSGQINNNGQIYLNGNFQENGGATYSAGVSNWLTFESSGSSQSIATNSALPRLRVNNNNKLVLAAALNITAAIDFGANSKIELGGFDLKADNVNISNYNDAAYVVTNGMGRLVQALVAGDIKEYPVGNATYTPVILLSNGGADDFFSIRIEDQALESGNSGAALVADAVAHTYHISEAVNGGNDVDIAVEWAAAQELSGFNRSLSGLAHWNGTSWDLPVYTAATASGGRWSQTKSNQTSFSPFIVIDNNSALNNTFPIELLSFEARRADNRKVKLDWTTATELNNRGFEVQRLIDGQADFVVVGFIDGFGTTNIATNYSFTDENSVSSVSYYRLRQVDNDGRATFSPMRAVRGSDAIASTTLVYPNPSRGDLYARLGEVPSGVAQGQIVAANGQVVLQFDFVAAAQQLLDVPAQNLSAGHYILLLSYANGVKEQIPFIRENK